jgi:hypothetical protein
MGAGSVCALFPLVVNHNLLHSPLNFNSLMCVVICASTQTQVAARLTKIEKSILQGCLDAVSVDSPCAGAYQPRTWVTFALLCLLLARFLASQLDGCSKREI